MIRIPFNSKSEKAQPLQSVIKSTAQETGLDQHTVAIAMSWFLEGIADEVSMGRVVRIPGFGVWAPWLVRHPAALARDPSPRCTVKFSPSRCFAQQVRWSAPASAAGTRALTRHRRSHSVGSKPDRASARTWTAMRAFRASIEAQMQQ